MKPRSALARMVACCATLTAGQAVTAPAAVAGGVGDLLSPAFGTACANNGVNARTQATATSSPDAGGGNALGLSATGPFNQCGGAGLAPHGEELLSKENLCRVGPELAGLLGIVLAPGVCG